MNRFEDILKGGDLRSVGKVDRVIHSIHTQKDFDTLYKLLIHPDRVIAMRAADAIEKFTRKEPYYLTSHATDLIQLALSAKDKEFKWHLAQLLIRLPLSDTDTGTVWELLYIWASDTTESRIVRANALDGLAFLSMRKEERGRKFRLLVERIEKEKIPSLSARIRKLKKTSG